MLGYFNKMSELLADVSLYTIDYNSDDSLIENKESALRIKKQLDDIMSLYHWLQTFIIDEVVEKDNAFYAELEDICCEFDVILMDIMMPVMNGYEATKIIRSLDREDAKEVPIIAMTANAFTEDRIRAKEAGMDEHLSKPIDAGLLYRMIWNYKTRG